MKKIDVIDSVAQIISGYAFKSNLFNEESNGLPLIRIRDIDKAETKNFTTQDYKDDYVVEKGDYLIGMDGEFNLAEWKGKKALLNQRVCKVIPDTSKVDRRYLYYFLPKKLKEIEDLTSYVTVKHISAKQIKNIDIPLPSLTTQRKIAETLDKADAIRKRTQQILVKYDQLAQSVFLEMFGDPVQNEKRWNFVPLSKFGSFKNGLNYGKDDKGHELRCLGVGDFKRHYKIDDINTLSKVSLASIPSKEYLLKDGDLVFVRSNGNKDLVGRCVAVFPGAEKVSFSGFCIRLRIDNEDIKSLYLTQLFRNSQFKQRMLNGGRGANIQNINQQILSNLKVPAPPIDLQNEFASIIGQIEKQKAKTKEELDRAEVLYQSLLQRAFTGSLFPESMPKETANA